MPRSDVAEDSSHVALGGFELPVLPALPAVLRCLNSGLNDSSAASRDALIDIIHSDPALLLKASQFVGLSVGGANTFQALHAGVCRLSPDILQSIARWALSWQYANNTPLLNEGGRYLWLRALHHACVGKALAEKAHLASKDEAYALGMFLEVGRLAFLKETKGRYIKEYLTLSPDKRVDFERSSLGRSAAEYGAQLVAPWCRSSFLADAIRYQGVPLEQVEGADPLIRSGVLIPRLAASLYGESAIPFAEVKQLLGLKKAEVTELLAQAQAAVNDRLSCLSEYGLPSQDARLDAMETQLRQLGADAGEGEEEQGVIAMEVGRSLAEESMRALFAKITDERQLQQSFQQALPLFFGDCNGVVLLQQEGRLQVFAERCDAPELLQALVFSTEATNSQVSSAFSQALPQILLQDEDDQHRSIVQDRQLLQFLNSPLAYCLPLSVAERTLGVLVLGFNAPVESVLARDLMAAFAATLAGVLQGVRRTRDHQEALQAEYEEAFHGRFSVLSHEVKNPLNIISNYLYLLGEKLGEEHPAQKDLSIITSEAARIGKILDQPRSFTLNEEAGRVDINQVVTQQQRLINASLLTEKGATISMTLDPQLPKISADGDIIKQILINLLKNAAEAVVDNTGKIEVTTSMTLYGDGLSYIAVEIKDNGPGISKEVYGRLFQRMTSTKGGEHAGVGLSIVKELVDELKGRVFCKTSVSGTVFTLLLLHNEGDGARDK